MSHFKIGFCILYAATDRRQLVDVEDAIFILVDCIKNWPMITLPSDALPKQCNLES